MSHDITLKWLWHVEWLTPEEYVADAIKQVFFVDHSKYQHIEVVELSNYGKALILDGKVQSTQNDEWIYHEALVHPAMITHHNPEKILVIGGGEGANLRELLKHRSVKQIVMVDLDEEVINVAKKHLYEWHLNAFNDPRVKLVIADGRKYVEESKEKFDVVILDLTDPVVGGPSYKLYTYEFYSAIKDNVLKKDSIVVTQATSVVYSINTHAMIRNTLSRIFKYAKSYVVHVPSFHSIWSFVIASDKYDAGVLTPREVNARIKEKISGELRFYDGETHLRMFILPKHIRERIQQIKEIAYDNKPPLMPI